MATKIVTVTEMRAIEQAADKSGHTYHIMMEHAGRALADHLLELLDEQALVEPQVLCLVGPGNNGGDALVAARHLVVDRERLTANAYLLAMRDESDPVFTAARDAGVKMIDGVADAKDSFQALRRLASEVDVIVDGLFGTGVRLPLKGEAAKVLKQVRAALDEGGAARPRLNDPSGPPPQRNRSLIVAVDCPSGLDCDTGELDPLTLHADSTVTFAAAKTGQLRFPGAAAVGRLVIGDIGLPDGMKELTSIKAELADGSLVRSLLPVRRRDAHKGTFGKAMVVAGSLNYVGAAYLAASAAYRVGAGLVTVGAPQVIVPTLAGMLPEATWLLLPHEMGVLHENAVSILREEIGGYKALLVGPGFGQEQSARRFIEGLLQSDRPKATAQHQIGFRFPGVVDADAESTAPQLNLPPLIIDADGLNLLAEIDDWWTLLPRDTILTPHPGEFARLAGIKEEGGVSPIEQVQADRLGMVAKFARKWKVVVVLKGAFTVVAQPNGHVTVMPFATSALATAGTGDVLAGAIAGLVAQGLEPAHAAIAGAWLHGYAGSEAELAYGTPASVTAGDLLDVLPAALAAVKK